jgi:hypothetical protein
VIVYLFADVDDIHDDDDDDGVDDDCTYVDDED